MKDKVEELTGFFEGLVSTKEKRQSLALWVSVAFAAVVLGTAGFMAGSQYLPGATTAQEIENGLLNYIGQTLPDADASVEEVTRIKGEGLYEVRLSIDGQEYTSYLTKSGSYLFPSGIPFDQFISD